MRAIKIEPDGDIREVQITGADVSAQNDSIHAMLCGYFDIVRMGRDACMLVDDEGLLKELPANPLATLISGYPVLVGTALIVGTRSGDDGDEFCDVPEHIVAAAVELVGLWKDAATSAELEEYKSASRTRADLIALGEIWEEE